MNENTGQFRTATFGGFHRQDVLDYIEQLTRNYRAEKEELAAQIEEAQRAAQEEQENRLHMEEERQALLTAKEAAESELVEAREAAEGKVLALQEAEERIQALEQKIREMEPSVKAWQMIRQTAGEIEVSAHERAQVTIRDAREKAAQIRQEGIQWMTEVQERCERLRSELSSSIAAAEGQLDVIREAFIQTELDLDGMQESITSLVEGLSSEENA